MFQLSEPQYAIVKKILAPHPYNFYVFGSRTKNKARPLSDLDLCIKDTAPIPFRTLAAREAAFEESDLPFKVDVKDWHTMSENFRALIQEDLTPFQGR